MNLFNHLNHKIILNRTFCTGKTNGKQQRSGKNTDSLPNDARTSEKDVRTEFRGYRHELAHIEVIVVEFRPIAEHQTLAQDFECPSVTPIDE